MKESSPRYIRVGDWYFEVKSVKAIRVDEYGKPYTAVANCSFNGDSMYVDGLLAKDEHEFSKSDYKAFYDFSKLMTVDKINYHRMYNGSVMTKNHDLPANSPFIEKNSKCANES
ncbi:hypothetical protein J7384_07545 [Endozoicomonas sp. G2_1]|uniref:hypothetical protein n=1 Tax=Endozoicomonas sp. G2_1 TaxID=2821091 RepID=UPI001ADC6042|nr:hypothetical protein [Endozoicomonas sp. G2_1]MBO9490210.1 hypothetical protein [Endozoicomonas sp. G2_1]